MPRRHPRLRAAVRFVLAAAALFAPSPALAWGERGHRLINEAAARALPEDVPDVLRREVAQLTHLGPEPDRWRVRDLAALDRASAPDHFIDVEIAHVDLAAPPRDRYEFLQVLIEAKERLSRVGFAPYEAIELCERIETSVTTWALLDPADPTREAAGRSVVYAAGVLGHYVGDLANPHHTTIHYNGWRGENPERFPTDPQTHWRFEEDFVDRLGDRLAVRVVGAARGDLDYARAVWELTAESHGHVRTLYRLDREGAFATGREDADAGQRGAAFARERMVRAATLLRDLWATACRYGLARARAARLARSVDERLTAVGLGDLWVWPDREGTATVEGRVDAAVARRVREAVRALPDGDRVRLRLLELH